MLAERLRIAMSERDITQTDLAREVGISQGAVSLILKGKTTKSRYLPDIAGVLNVSLPWLEGDTDDPHEGHNKSVVAKALRDEGLTRIREFNLSYAMGDGTYLITDAAARWRYFDLSMVKELTSSDPGNLFVARGVGDSMLPTLFDNDTILIDHEHRNLDQQDRLWAISYGDLGMIKRLRRLPTGKLLIVSDNPAVADFEASTAEVHIIGRVVWVGRRM